MIASPLLRCTACTLPLAGGADTFGPADAPLCAEHWFATLAGDTRRTMPLSAVSVHLCCNSPGDGAFLGEVCCIELYDPCEKVDPLVRWEYDSLHCPRDRGEKCSFWPTGKTFIMGGQEYACWSHGTWVGSMCWDCVTMAVVDAHRLHDWLRQEAGWSATVTTEGWDG